jgi:hypothetical protein
MTKLKNSTICWNCGTSRLYPSFSCGMQTFHLLWSAWTKLQITSSKPCSISFLFSDEINSRHPVILGLRNILKMACSNDITTLTLPVLLMHEMTEVNHNTCVIDCGSRIWCGIELLYFYSKTNQMHNISNLFYFGTMLCMFRTFSPSIIRSLRLYIQH